MKFDTSTQSDMQIKMKYISSFKSAPKSHFKTGVLPSPLLGIALQRFNFASYGTETFFLALFDVLFIIILCIVIHAYNV